MFIISLIGLIVNIVVALIMFKGGDTNHNLNMRGAFIHVLGDLLDLLVQLLPQYSYGHLILQLQIQLRV